MVSPQMLMNYSVSIFLPCQKILCVWRLANCYILSTPRPGVKERYCKDAQ
jgi:hypothetical protein